MTEAAVTFCFWFCIGALIVSAAVVVVILAAAMVIIVRDMRRNALDARRRRARRGWHTRPESSVPLPSTPPRRVPTEAVHVQGADPEDDDASPHDINRVIAAAIQACRDAATHH